MRKIQVFKLFQVLSLLDGTRSAAFRYLLCGVGLLLSVSINAQVRWTLWLEQPQQPPVEVLEFPSSLEKSIRIDKKVAGFNVRIELSPAGTYQVFKVSAYPLKGSKAVYFSLRGVYPEGQPYCFNGPVAGSEIYRQSPHDVDAWIVTTIAEQAVPMVAVRTPDGFAVALNDTPAKFDNFTSQAFFLEQKKVLLCSGDSGASPGLKPDTSSQLDLNYNAEAGQKFTPGKVVRHFHTATRQQPHLFEGIWFNSRATDLNGLRRDVNQNAALHFSNGKYDDYFGALAFTTAYMNLRTNDTGKSRYWVVPSVEYANTQYGRDAFWIATMLPPEYDAECMANELHTVNPFAEYPLFAIIWAYRSFKANRPVNPIKVQAYMDEIERRARDNAYFAYDERTGRQDFQYWGDVMAFEKNDVITFNQGLFALALKAGQSMGLKIRSNPDAAVAHYRNMYNSELGFFPISLKKNTILGPDPLAPDLLGQMYFGVKMLESSQVQSHFNRMMRYSKTPFGFKIVASADGTYLPAAAYDVEGYQSQVNRENMPDGRYFRGGSYFLYDNLFLIDAYLHGVPGAEQALIERVSHDFKAGNTTYETLNTLSGEPWKPNMGWNVAIYAFWKQLVSEGKADRKLFDAVDKIAKP
jgi:hypothetical protein